MRSSNSHLPGTVSQPPVPSSVLTHPAARRPLEQRSDEALTTAYWAARSELDALRRARAEEIARQGPGEAPRRIIELEGLCERIWNEGRRRAVAAELLAA